MTPAPTLAISPDASTPTTSGSLPLGKRHAAEAPDVEIIERDRLDAHLHLAAARRRRIGHLGQFKLAVGDQSERAHGGEGGAADYAGSRPITSETFCPPKPKELEMTWVTLASRALLGTTSSGIAGSGIV